MAINDYTQPSSEQMKVALSKIAGMAMSLRVLCSIDVDRDTQDAVISMARNMASQIGWIADRCRGFESDTPDGWMLPPAWEWEREKGDAQQFAGGANHD